ncbi:DUF6527 family protein [Kitasatospora aureofaciens]|uniref:DUF6527 family protein n=1 Tax=Kitasatospora aureofaciens TaxID=1894 RepID=UPI000AED00FD
MDRVRLPLQGEPSGTAQSQPERPPNWTVKSSKPLTVSPSIDELRGSERCHYFIRDGHIVWT